MKKSLYWAAAALAACAAGWIAAPSALAICRAVEPLSESGRRPVMFDPTTMALIVMAEDQIVGYECPPEPERAEALPWQREDPALPSPFPLPFPEIEEQRAPADPSVCWDGSDAVEIIDSLTHVVVQPSIYADGGSAGLIMPVPRRADVHAAPAEVFDAVAALQKAQIVETVHYQEDPNLGYQCSDPHYSDNTFDALAGAPLMLMGCSDMGDYYRPGLEGMDVEVTESGDGVVMSETIATTSDYEVTMLNASTLEALLTWLDDNQFAHDEDDDLAFSAYVREGAWFMALKVTPRDLGGEHVALAPLVVSWLGSEVPIMNALQYDPAGGLLITDAFILASTQMALDDGDGTLLYSAPAAIAPGSVLDGFALGESWLTRIEVARRAHEIKTDTFLRAADELEVFRRTVTRELEVRIAAACCGSNTIPDPDGVRRRYTEHREYVEGAEPPGEEFFYTTPPPDEAYCPGGDAYDESSYSDDYLLCASSPPTVARRRMLSLGSWLPLIGVLGAIALRSRRRRRGHRTE